MAAKFQHGFKLVYTDGLILKSFCAPKQVTYLRNRWVKRPEGCGPLCVFPTLADVRFYVCLDHIDPLASLSQLYECDYVPSSDTQAWISPAEGVRQYAGGMAPGTVYADKVRVTKEVDTSLECFRGD